MIDISFNLFEDDDFWKVDEPTPTISVIAGRPTNEDDYWDAKCESSKNECFHMNLDLKLVSKSHK